MDKTIAKGLSEITRKEWIVYQWVEDTTPGDDERHFIPAGSRTPDEAMQAAEEWDFLESVKNDEEEEREIEVTNEINQLGGQTNGTSGN